MKRLAVYVFAFMVGVSLASSAWAQQPILQGGPFTSGHLPMYVGTGSSQPIAQDGGGAGGGGVGINPSELGITARGSGTPPYAGQGTGPLGTNMCDYDGPLRNSAGVSSPYHYLCFSANAQGGGLITYGAGNGAAQLPMTITINGVSYSFPGSLSGITINITAISNGTPNGVLYDNAGTVGNTAAGLTNRVLHGNTGSAPAFSSVTASDFGTQSANSFLSGPTSGAAATPTFRSIVGADLPAGVDTNTLNAQTVDYTLLTTDCGKTVTLAGGFTTLTVPAASGFPATCSVVIQNIGGTRGKKMAINGTTFPNGNILPPLQSFTLKNMASVWWVQDLPNRWKLPSTTAFFVDGTNGLDTNDGLAAGTGGPFQTIQKSIDNIVTNLDLNEQAVTVDVAVGNYPENLWLGNYSGQKSQFGFGQVLIRATNATCANTKINPTSGSGIFATGGNPPYTFQGFQFESPGNSVYSVQMDSGGFVALKAACFGPTNAGHLLAQFGGSRIAMVASTFNVVGGGTIFMDAQHGSDIYFQPGSNVTLTGTPLYAIWARAKDVGRILTNQTTYTGSANAATQRYSVENNGTIDTGDNASLPGGVDGKVYAGGVYNGLLLESKQGFANHPVLTNIGTPVLSSCGTGPGFSGPATDAGGRFVTGTGATACTITFNQPWPNSGVPICIVTAIDKASALVYAEGNTTLVLSSASASAGYRYWCDIGQ